MQTDNRDLFFYRYNNSYEDLKNNNQLIWNVLYEDWSAKQIVVFNIFEHGNFLVELINSKKELQKQFGKDAYNSHEAFTFFEEKVRSALSYYYGSKSEWEVVVTSWPPYVESEEIDRLVQEKQKRLEQQKYFYRTNVNLNVGTKIDVYTQVRLNWTQFIDYLLGTIDE